MHLKQCLESCIIAINVHVTEKKKDLKSVILVSPFRILKKKRKLIAKEIKMKMAKINTTEDGQTTEEIKLGSGFKKRLSNTEKSPARLLKMKGKKGKRADARKTTMVRRRRHHCRSYRCLKITRGCY